MQELREDEFKDLLDEERQNAEFVTETVLETDFEIWFRRLCDQYPWTYSALSGVGWIDSNEMLELYKEQIMDRFGPLPQRRALLRTIQLRWMAKDIGFEKVVLKSGKMICYFVSRQDSPIIKVQILEGLIFVKQSGWEKCTRKMAVCMSFVNQLHWSGHSNLSKNTDAGKVPTS